jgi:hypothetical protein
MGLPVSDTEEEDGEEDRSLAGDAEPEEEDDIPLTRRPRQRKKQQTTRAKGKEKAPSKSGPLSDDARKEAQELAMGDEITHAAAAMAGRHNTTMRNILIAAGFGIKESCATNPFNKHAEWYAYHFPKDPKGTFHSIKLLDIFLH